jgi:hypothetical protein
LLKYLIIFQKFSVKKIKSNNLKPQKGGDGKWQTRRATVAAGVLDKSRVVLKPQATKRNPRSPSNG